LERGDGDSGGKKEGKISDQDQEEDRLYFMKLEIFFTCYLRQTSFPNQKRHREGRDKWEKIQYASRG